MLNHSAFLHRMLLENNYSLPAGTEEKFIHYLDLLAKWNKIYNLTSIRDPNDMVMLHILDSLSINPYLHGTRILDVGTGAGLPGIPLAIIQPEKKFTLMDSNSKKTRFLTQVVLELKLTNVEVIHSRCEDLRPEQPFDSILSRAFASLRVMLEATHHLVAKHGRFLAMKGVYPESEIQELQQGFKVLAVHKLVINGLAAERHLVCLAKED
jgi:16S rRNA (guanine527-N7)-methyltransferase